MSYFRPAKKQKLQESSSITLPSNIKTKKHNFSIEINSNSKNNSNQDTPSWIQYDLTQTNEQLDLFGNWKVHEFVAEKYRLNNVAYIIVCQAGS